MTERVQVGTSGWHYAHWRGPFYPEHPRPAGMIEMMGRERKSYMGFCRPPGGGKERSARLLRVEDGDRLGLVRLGFARTGSPRNDRAADEDHDFGI